ncbi:hypothetical protein BABINDRAFT_162347 [Babjeviella inositovora NRRL Y-12698]|uniref:N-acetylglucosaminylphosphatidylinositol deacetylase n=1 Tax=Babjeviella inositovora NRRL Y-12698 TaxID=984486 RepID=A0A1E3QLQ5_9ASCO|nr:uncharacterized protein BABINDRAFT_162347 [Babjeviella inositovora NRRL Y-12698]ODQ78639.1 hypothetical protein BABINDRAFT_162347 [Babjeviella inositovora NRRL Y-12698]
MACPKCAYSILRIPVRILAKLLFVSCLAWIVLTNALLCYLHDGSSPSLSTIPVELTNKDIYFLIAHPDDEVMFFGPTILELSLPKYNNSMNLLCLSTGNGAGLGSTRELELLKSTQILFSLYGSQRPQPVVKIVNDEARFMDTMDAEWDAQLVAEELGLFVKTSDALVITFDEGGVSGHPNHVSLFEGAKVYVSQTPASLYTLSSASSVWEKYSFTLITNWKLFKRLVASRPHSVLAQAFNRRFSPIEVDTLLGGAPVEIYATMNMFLAAVGAMAWGHYSQMVWFRYGWMLLSRYLTFNELRLVQ